MPTLSVILITRNEETNLRDCLASLGGLAQQVVVVDTASTDGTIAIAQEFGATIAQPVDWPGFGPQKNRALDLATGDWVLSLDADERLTPALQAEIAGVLKNRAMRPVLRSLGCLGIAAASFAIRAGIPIT
jgi:glycosyltransferase involved in cell wall biosynthesis